MASSYCVEHYSSRQLLEVWGGGRETVLTVLSPFAECSPTTPPGRAWWHFPFLLGRKVCSLAISALHQLWNPDAPGTTGPWQCAATLWPRFPTSPSVTLAQLGNTQVLTRPVGLAGSARGGGGGDQVGKAEASSYFCGD